MRKESEDSCCLPLRQELRRSKFSLHHADPGVFCRSQWQRGERSVLWLLYRWLLATFYSAGVIGSLLKVFNEGTWFIYLTHWGFSLCLFASVYGAVVASIYFSKPTYFAPGSVALKIYWLSHFTTVALSMLVTLIYWAALYPSMPEIGADLNNLWEHAFNSIFMILDCFMLAFPTHILHCIYPLAVILTFGFFSLVYHWCNGHDFDGNPFIYPILDWARPGLAIGTLCGCLLLVCCFSVCVFGLYRLRLCIYNCCGREQKSRRRSTKQSLSPYPYRQF
ncbi:protein rolling stone-like [Drosophila guanche]|uniref:protein rolling stone-like n=1 Tax=Drosophila guanche TaxID=7266 RepID=UPI0014721D52|nr:protein rolling stone-like [Drosophila guanche]